MKTFLLNTFLFCLSAFAQSSAQEWLYEGNTLMAVDSFAPAEIAYKKALDAGAKNFAAHFNYGDALYKQERLNEAKVAFEKALSKAQNDKQRAMAKHNLGNTAMREQNLENAIEHYKDALRLNPNDEETRYNLSAALSQKRQQQEKQKQEQDQNKDQKQDQNQNQKQDQNKDQNQDQKQDQNKDQNSKNNSEKDQKDQQDQQEKNQKNEENTEHKNVKPQPKNLSKEEAEKLLQAIRRDEQNLQNKRKKEKMKGIIIKSDKDW